MYRLMSQRNIMMWLFFGESNQTKGLNVSEMFPSKLLTAYVGKRLRGLHLSHLAHVLLLLSAL